MKAAGWPSDSNRHVVGTMVVEETLIGEVDHDGACASVRLPTRAAQWLAGGRRSMGWLTARRLAECAVPRGCDPAEGRPAGGNLPFGSSTRSRGLLADR